MITRHHWGVRVVVGLVSLMITISAGRTIIELWRRQDVLKSREQELAVLEEEKKALERTLQDMGSESYVERVARDKLGLVKEGETIVILPGTGDRGPGTENTQENVANWRKWWGLFF